MSHQSSSRLKILYYAITTVVVYLTLTAAGFAIAFIPTQDLWLSLLIGLMTFSNIALFVAFGHAQAHIQALHKSYKKHLMELHTPVNISGELSNLFEKIAKDKEKPEEKVASSQE